MKSSDVEKIKSLGKGQSFKINDVEYVFIKNVDADSIIAGNRETGKQEQINLTFFTNKTNKTMTNTNEVSVKKLVHAMLVKDLRTEARKFKIVGYSKMAKVVLQEKVIGEIEAAKPKTEAERFEDVIVKLARQKVDATIAKDQATDQDSKNFQSELIKDLNVALKEAKAKLNILLNPVVEITKEILKERGKPTHYNEIQNALDPILYEELIKSGSLMKYNPESVEKILQKYVGTIFQLEDVKIGKYHGKRWCLIKSDLK